MAWSREEPSLLGPVTHGLPPVYSPSSRLLNLRKLSLSDNEIQRLPPEGGRFSHHSWWSWMCPGMVWSWGRRGEVASGGGRKNFELLEAVGIFPW